MNSPVVFVELHLLCARILQPYTPATLLTAEREITFFQNPFPQTTHDFIVWAFHNFVFDGDLLPFNIGLTT